MAFSFNQVTLLGNLTRDMEVRYTPNGVAVATGSVATNRSYKDKNTDEWKDIPEFHRIKIWGRAAETFSKLGVKGTKVFVVGRMETQKWDDREKGVTRYNTEVNVNEFVILTKKDSGSQQPEVESKTAPEPEKDYTVGDVEDIADEVPF